MAIAADKAPSASALLWPRRSGRAEPASTVELITCAGLALSLLVLLITVGSGDRALVASVVAEGGWIERLSPPAWLLLGLLIPALAGRSARSLSLALLCLLFALRELDLHQLIGSTSFLKLNFYRGDLPAPQKLGGALLALLSIGAVAWALLLNLPAFIRGGHHARSWGRLVLLAAALLVVAKVLDRTPATWNAYFLDPQHWSAVALANLAEEWLEFFVPLALCAALIQRRRSARAPSPAA
jgi:hypothetical protein